MTSSATTADTDLTTTSCDYLVVGAGATGMAFVDSLLQGLGRDEASTHPSSKRLKTTATATTTATASPLRIVLMDQHDQPGGQWNDSYGFVRLHQPSAMYGVESTPLDPISPGGEASSSQGVAEAHRATRQEILDYYAALVQKWESSSHFEFQFVGNASFDFDSVKSATSTTGDGSGSRSYQYTTTTTTTTNTTDPTSHTIQVTRRVVDARYLAPDLPVTTPPKFAFDATTTRVVPVNDLYNQLLVEPRDLPDTTTNHQHYFVIMGAGKTGMDAVYYLLKDHQVAPSQILWVAPHDPWITAREQIGNCLEFLRDTALMDSRCDLTSVARVQETFEFWEEQGKIYRLFISTTQEPPTKFNDATLSEDELVTLQRILPSHKVRGRGRVQRIDGRTGALILEDDSVVALPWGDIPDSLAKTTYVHCSAGAFNYTKQIGLKPVPVFQPHQLTLQDVYGTPGFCFVGSISGKLESLCYQNRLTDDEANRLCRVPQPPSCSDPLGPSGGDVVGLSKDHGWVQRLVNLKRWLAIPDLRNWLVGHRLFNLGHYPSADAMDRLVEETWTVFQKEGLVENE